MKNNKRIVSIALVIVLLFTGVAYASSINGFFEGFSIVNIFIDGKKIQGDVPAINFHGRTMVPVRFVSEELGADVQWEGSTASVYINNNSTNTTLSDNYTQKDINLLKLYSEIANQYKQLEDLGNLLSETNGDLLNFISNYQHDVDIPISHYDQYNYFVNKFNRNVDTFNQLTATTEILVAKAKLSGIDIANMYATLNSYSDAIDLFNISFDSAFNYYETNQSDYFYSFTFSSMQAKNTIYPNLKNSNSRYNDFHEMILNY